ncbi:Fic family protein [Micromonospora sp. WMMD1128]|uniref:Fic family protein n=1 Tax=unclassified Micromonospora TaxID=2617518 RepID=UPI00248BA03E|nr:MULTISPECIES: Fic family protein [unclassified Micromonospora]WBB73136.1 Fic family protein [Micromonospora sp. WMMD1128]WFE33409.1 Fic family protein [Micromonospora sp. WMMD975]
MIYRTPELSDHDRNVLGEIHDMRHTLADVLRSPRRWTGGLRRTMLARAILGSNSIEGYVVAEDDAAAALDGEEPLSADDRTFAEIRGYRQALGYVLQTAGDPYFRFETSTIRSMHYMMLSHDLAKSPGQYRKGPIYVHDERTDRRVYEGADADDVPHLMEELAEDLRSDATTSPLVKASMAHLNLVMIHPFRDGNGRMARALQTLVLSRRAIVEPAFSSIEEWLGSNTEDYYRVLAITGQGHWNPEGQAHLWVSFNLRAHHMQAQTVARRFREASEIWSELDSIVAERKLPERVTDLLYEAVLGYRVRRSGYVKLSDVEERTATRDLTNLADQGLLEARGERRGRHYVAGSTLAEVRERVRAARAPVSDPYPDMPVRLATGAATAAEPSDKP